LLFVGCTIGRWIILEDFGRADVGIGIEINPEDIFYEFVIGLLLLLLMVLLLLLGVMLLLLLLVVAVIFGLLLF